MISQEKPPDSRQVLGTVGGDARVDHGAVGGIREIFCSRYGECSKQRGRAVTLVIVCHSGRTPLRKSGQNWLRSNHLIANPTKFGIL